MKNLFFLILGISFFNANSQAQQQNSGQAGETITVERENLKAFLQSDLDKYVVYDLMSDGSKVFKDTLDFNEYRDKAIFTITQNQTVLNRQLWATISLLVITIGLLVFLIKRK